MMSVQEEEKRLVTDQMGRSIMVPVQPKRIISLVPSQTELLYYLGVGSSIAAQTIFCIHPKKESKQAVKIGGTKKLRMDAIRQLNPDLIIGNKEENERGQISELAQDFPVWMSDIKNLNEAIEMIHSVGIMTNTEPKAKLLIGEIQEAFLGLSQQGKKGRALYLIWQDPWMAVGKETFIDDMLQRAGFENAVTTSRYPELSTEQICNLDVSHIFLSSEPFPFRQQHLNSMKKLKPQCKVQLVDGELFSWYGSRLLLSADYLSVL
ncbi:MAG: hypothetical protein RLZZ370_112 [Bacteroidota bacterium]|jgi:ABC-type Fe3+-hydroxamate transport system substrate-binding protein